MLAKIDGVIYDTNKARIVRIGNDGMLAYTLYANANDDHGFLTISPMKRGSGCVLIPVNGGNFRRLFQGSFPKNLSNISW